MEIFSITICLLFIAFFSSLIVAYTYSNKIFLNLESKKENITSYTLKILSENPRLYISTLKAGNTIALVIFSFYYISYTESSLNVIQSDSNLVFTALIYISIAILLVYIFSKFIPQTFIKPYANQVILNSNLPIRIIIKLFSPITNPLLKLSDWFLRKIMNLTQDKENQLLSISELGSYITKQIETSEDNEKLDTELQILKNALSFTDVLVKKAMVQKIQIETVNVNDSLENIINKFIETGYSRLLVYEDNEDNIIGYIHIFEILENPKSTKSIVYPIETVSENSLIKDLFKRLSIKRKSIAKVLNDKGEFTGIITMEDIIEELFGEIDDEHDANIQIVEKEIAPNKFVISTRLDVEYLNKKFNFGLTESDDYKNLEQYILYHHKQIPAKGDVITIEKNQFKILSLTDKKIEIVEIIKN
ncbi:HlyC/CorC family transporter [Paenimyroides tangerinum]|uniref:HlyC/CorC family transporter n=1 Tax=Paenimyroides tangerinum TaxID=2488728 RepID=A0A3P3VZC9_9FLAO|nr:hemolysin family protein [Paenimyroides tangerinum]RRJ88070.1 HlyC/CorC family transporter [Paenimyroides tangerinum]